jgi:hypothetical protein
VSADISLAEPPADVARVLRLALATIDEAGGWQQRGPSNDVLGQRCLVGAIHHVLGGSKYPPGSYMPPPIWQAIRRVLEFQRNALGCESILNWHNEEGRSAEHVFRAVRAAIAAAEAA